nr:LPS export ABC transporter periplasmic protein LptC [uncultured Kingella sp.]
MNRFRSLLFPLALALILGGLTSWLGRVSEVVIEEVKLDPAQPQYTMTQIHGIRYDISGSLNQDLTAPRAWQLPDQKNVYFQQPTLKTYRDNNEQYTVSSQTARYELASKKVFFEQNVVLIKNPDAERPAGKVATDYLNVDTQTQIAETDAPVQYEYGRSQGTATGLTYDNKNGLLNLKSKVKAQIYDLK